MVLVERRSGVGTWRKVENGMEDAYAGRKTGESVSGKEGKGSGGEGADETDGR